MQSWTDPAGIWTTSPDLTMQLSLTPAGSPESSGGGEFPQVPFLNRMETRGRQHWQYDLPGQPSSKPVWAPALHLPSGSPKVTVGLETPMFPFLRPQ